MVNIGHAILQDFAISIDQRAHRVRFVGSPSSTRPTTQTPPKAKRRLGIRMKLSSDAVVVGSVDPGSAAEKAGLHAGDTIVSIDGREEKIVVPAEPTHD